MVNTLNDRARQAFFPTRIDYRIRHSTDSCREWFTIILYDRGGTDASRQANHASMSYARASSWPVRGWVSSSTRLWACYQKEIDMAHWMIMLCQFNADRTWWKGLGGIADRSFTRQIRKLNQFNETLQVLWWHREFTDSMSLLALETGKHHAKPCAVPDGMAWKMLKGWQRPRTGDMDLERWLVGV